MSEKAQSAIYPNRAPRRMVSGIREIDTLVMETQPTKRVRIVAIGLAALVLAACASTTPPAQWSMAPAQPTMAEPVATAASAVAAAWAARPAFVRQDSMTEEAYAYALANPQVLMWMPCYCGCAAMDHGSNLDCFVVPGDGNAIRFEEHASYCDVCVKTALMAKQMSAEGKTLRQIRDAVDSTFGNKGAPGTDTAMPAA